MRKWQKIATLAEKRGHRRTRVMLPAIVTRNGEPTRSFVRNISRTGAMVDAIATVAKGDEVVLLIGESSIRSRIIWVDHSRFGI